MSESGDKPLIVGIDLGTTNSLVAFCDERGPRVLGAESEDGGVVPSVVAFDAEAGRPTIGLEARRHAVERPTTTVFSVKRLMGKGFADVQDDLRYLPYAVVQLAGQEGRDIVGVQIGDRILTPPEISAAVLRELKVRAERELRREVRQAVITVPAYFDDAQRQATRDAGKIAGLEVLRIVNEPTAAALAYGLDRAESSTIAVYDLGGGTFDVSILRVSGGVFEVLSTHGDTHLGGDDFDRQIMETVVNEVRRQFGVEIDSPQTKQALRNFAEAVKIRLSSDQQASLEIDLGKGRQYRRVITRDELEAMIEPFVERTLQSCRKALSDADLNADHIDEVVMVGGSTRTPLVRRRVGELFGRTPYTALDPDRVVALGAATQASILAGVSRELLLLDVTPLSMGIETMGGAMGKLIMRNTRVPCQAREMFTTFVDGQTNIKINVLQGERELAEHCRSLGQFELRDLPPMPAGLPKIEVTFLIDHNGILSVSAKELRSGREASVQIVPAHGLTAEEVERIELESYEFARQDMTAHRLIDLRNQVAFDTHKAEQTLAKVGEELEPAERGRIEAAMRDLRKLAETSQDADLIYQRLQAFGRMTVRLAELGMTAALRSTLKE